MIGLVVGEQIVIKDFRNIDFMGVLFFLYDFDIFDRVNCDGYEVVGIFIFLQFIVFRRNFVSVFYGFSIGFEILIGLMC